MGEQKQKLVRHASPGETRAVLMDRHGRPCRIYIERWHGASDPARWGSVHAARLRAFSEEIKGAFVELESGEEAVLRLTSRTNITEGKALHVRIESERRSGKLARVSIVEEAPDGASGFSLWRAQIENGNSIPIEDNPETVQAAMDEALADSVTLSNGGRLHIEPTRALTAFDVDTAGRSSKGSAGARALSINRDAVKDMARQVALRGLGGNLVLDCIAPLNQDAREKLLADAIDAFHAYGFARARILAPSAIGLMQLSLPWRFCPVADRLNEDPAETELLTLLRDLQREANANPAAFYAVELSPDLWNVYVRHRQPAEEALRSFFSGRVAVRKSENQDSRMIKA